MELISTPPENRPTPEQEQKEAEALIAVANAIQAELPAVTSPHWHQTLERTRGRLSAAAACRGYRPSLDEVN
jgi:hypothetical protein